MPTNSTPPDTETATDTDRLELEFVAPLRAQRKIQVPSHVRSRLDLATGTPVEVAVKRYEGVGPSTPSAPPTVRQFVRTFSSNRVIVPDDVVEALDLAQDERVRAWIRRYETRERVRQPAGMAVERRF